MPPAGLESEAIENRKRILEGLTLGNSVFQTAQARFDSLKASDQGFHEEDLAVLYETYVAAYEDALELFDFQEITVARWVCIEMYGAIAQLFASVRSIGSTGRSPGKVVGPRLGMLSPWFDGGPVPGFLTESWIADHDTLRHDVVPPHSEFPDDAPLPSIFFRQPPV